MTSAPARYRPITEITAAEGIDLGQASRVAQLARLAPKLVEVCVAHRPEALSLEPIVRRKLPALWAAQEEMVPPAMNT